MVAVSTILYLLDKTSTSMGSICVALIAMLIMTEFWTRAGPKVATMVRRKRICNSCQRRFSTAEKIEKLSVRVVKSDQTREPLDREKIRRGIERACSSDQFLVPLSKEWSKT